MEIIDIFDKKGIAYGNSILISNTEEKVIKFHQECVEMDKKYLGDIK